MGDDGDSCCTKLGLGIGLGDYIPKFDHSKEKKVVSLDLSFPHDSSDEVLDIENKKENKRSSNCGYEDDNKNINTRKKLRLSKEQSNLLEESFNIHNTLNSNQKQTLAEKLNLQPRQVEVWFQNRRARTKLKQTEVDCEYMRNCCEKLSEENHRLKKELHELLELKLRPLYVQFPKAASTLKMCSSCSAIGKTPSLNLSNNVKEEKTEEQANGLDAVKQTQEK